MVLRIVMPLNYTATLYEGRVQSLSRIKQSPLHIPDGPIILFYVVCYGITCQVYYQVWEIPIYGYDLNKVAVNSYIDMTVIALRKSVLKVYLHYLNPLGLSFHTQSAGLYLNHPGFANRHQNRS